MKQGKTVFVGLSGGVDSSVAALRLKRAGYQVVGVFIKVWHPEFMVCNWEAERLDAMRVAAHLEIPFLTCDAEATYRDAVAHYFIEEYKAGRTPNPDILCNKEVKFGAFLRFAKEKGADYVATGHYVLRKEHPKGTSNRFAEGASSAELHRGRDIHKDQSYFLWSLSPEQIAYSLFPIGDSDKEEIRKEAARAAIPTAAKKDSQGICFLGHVDIPEFLSHYTTLVPGDVLDSKGTIIGTHQGALVYTLGQRHGFTLTNNDTARPQLYVIAKDLEKNTVTVSEQRPVLAPDETIRLEQLVLRVPLSSGDTVEAQFRYRQTPFPITITTVGHSDMTISAPPGVERPAAGQSCVIYQGSLCVGGGIIE